ncbi:unnamed protein product [Arctia plantaginis]|uniref:unspecific monooxygenase n=1 Tax=Arctia plantaginis TaxID=874455 RepID=A0A8S1BFI7_ARCPL|nr:unnamed protein product [Arctia plantaginis]
MLGKLLLYTVLTLLFFSTYLAYKYVKKRLQYWKKRNVPYVKPVPILGNFADFILFKKYVGHVLQDLCQKFPNAPFFGAFFGTEPTLVVQDPEIIKLIMTKDFNFFSGREILKYSAREMLTQSLFFTYDPQALAKKEENPFKAAGEQIFDSQHMQAFKNISRAIWPAIFYGLGLQVFSKKLETFFYSLLTGVFKGRQYKATNKNDFVDLLLKLREQKQQSPESFDGLEINDDMLVAQCFLFFAAGFDTSANTSSFTLFELAKNPQAQEKALEEVDAYLRRHNNVLEYECLTEMPYLEAWPRICIGLRFAKMQVIAGLVTLLKKYRVELAEGMERKVEFEPKALITYPISGINLKFIEREGWKDRVFQSPKSKVSS